MTGLGTAPATLRREASAGSGPAGQPAGTLSVIGLHVARCHAFPKGSILHGYTILAPLDDLGRLDVEQWRHLKDKCVVRRFWQGEPEKSGHLIHRSGGAGGATWCLSFESAADVGIAAGFHLDDHRFIPGSYLSFTGKDDQQQTYQVDFVRPLIRR